MKSSLKLKLDKIMLLLLFAHFFSCQDIAKVEETNPESKTITENVTEVAVNKDFAFLENAQERKLPLKDSTNFDNFSSDKILNQNQLDLIQIKKISDKNPENVVVHYKLNLSNQFKTFVFTYNMGEMELFSTLVNYDNNYRFISKLEIAYDEIAESWFRTESEIDGKEIIVNEMNYTEEIEKSSKTIYKINADGTIVTKN